MMVPLGLLAAKPADLDIAATRALVFSGATRNSLVCCRWHWHSQSRCPSSFGGCHPDTHRVVWKGPLCPISTPSHPAEPGRQLPKIGAIPYTGRCGSGFHLIGLACGHQFGPAGVELDGRRASRFRFIRELVKGQPDRLSPVASCQVGAHPNLTSGSPDKGCQNRVLFVLSLQ